MLGTKRHQKTAKGVWKCDYLLWIKQGFNKLL